MPMPRAAPTTAPRLASASSLDTYVAIRVFIYTTRDLDFTLRPALPCVPVMTFGSRAGSSVYHPVTMARDPRSTHQMVTRRATGVTKPVGRLQLSAVAAPPTLSPVDLRP
jgi:hypothetical protein